MQNGHTCLPGEGHMCHVITGPRRAIPRGLEILRQRNYVSTEGNCFSHHAGKSLAEKGRVCVRVCTFTHTHKEKEKDRQTDRAFQQGNYRKVSLGAEHTEGVSGETQTLTRICYSRDSICQSKTMRVPCPFASYRHAFLPKQTATVQALRHCWVVLCNTLYGVGRRLRKELNLWWQQKENGDFCELSFCNKLWKHGVVGEIIEEINVMDS